MDGVTRRVGIETNALGRSYALRRGGRETRRLSSGAAPRAPTTVRRPWDVACRPRLAAPRRAVRALPPPWRPPRPGPRTGRARRAVPPPPPRAAGAPRRAP